MGKYNIHVYIKQRRTACFTRRANYSNANYMFYTTMLISSDVIGQFHK